MDIQSALTKPLITGASVSANFGSMSPARKLALRYTAAENIQTVAFGGKPGVEIFKSLTQAKLADRSGIFAVDFFFWDATFADLAASLKTLDRLVKMAKAQDIPIVLGEIPALLPGFQPGRDQLNIEINRQCQAYAKGAVMPFDRLHREIMKTGAWATPTERLTLRQIVPDGLHLSNGAAEALANLLESVMRARTDAPTIRI